MKLKIYGLLTLMSIILAGCFSCSDDNCDFFPLDGSDADITQWTMRTDEGLEFGGLISGNSISVFIPDGVDINSLNAVWSLSEGATIYPDPESISDWSSAQSFTVTSINTENTKEWIVKVHFAGDAELLTPVTITSQTALEEFAALGYRKLNSLTITDGTESPVTDLSPLKHIEEVSGRLTIRQVSVPTVEMSGLQTVGDLTVNSPSTLEKVSFPVLQRSLGDIYIGDKTTGSVAQIHNGLKNVEFPALTYVAGSFTVYWCQNVEIVNTDRLTHIGADYIIDTGNITNLGMLQSLKAIPGSLRIFCPSLQSLEGFGITSIKGSFFLGVGEVRSLRPLECLKSVGSLSLNSGANLTSLEGISHLDPQAVTINACPKLTSLEGCPIGPHTRAVYITRMEQLVSLNGLEKLRQADELQISNCVLLSDLSPITSLTEADNLVITNTGVVNIPEFPSLTALTGTLEIYNNKSLKSLAGFKHLKSVCNLTVSGCVALPSLDGLQNLTTCPGRIQIVGNSELSSFTAVRNLLIDNWDRVTLRRNKYNPTLQQLQDGETEL